MANLFGFLQRAKVPEPIRIAAAASVAGDALDILSTVLVLKLFTDVSESNPLMVDALGGFLVYKAILIKSAFFASAGIMAFVLQKVFKDGRLSALPFIYTAFTSFMAGFNNLLLIFGHK